MLRVGVFADLHLDAAFEGLGRSGVKRRANRRETLKNIVQAAKSEGCDALLGGGDLYEHDRSGRDTGNWMRHCFEETEMPVLLVPGNHDWLGPPSIYATTRWPSNVIIADSSGFEPMAEIGGVTFWGFAHHGPIGTPSPFGDGFHVDDVGVHIALFHGAAAGHGFEEFNRYGQPKAGHAPFDTRDIRAAGFAHAFVGHYHTARDAPDHTYPGTPDPLNFGDPAQAGLVVAEIDDSGGLVRRRIDVSVSRVHDVTLDISGLDNGQAVVDRAHALLDGLSGFVRMKVIGEQHCDIDLDLNELEQIEESDIDHLSVQEGDLVPEYDLEALAVDPGIRGEFIRRVGESGVPDDRQREVILVGLRALDSRALVI